MSHDAVPERPSLEGLEAKWMERWEESGVYRFDRSQPRDRIFSIDTPPPTVSGSLHMGSVFGYVQTDAVARYQRMKGQEVFYPMGWDDNGLPTERRVQDFYGVHCDPGLPYEPGYEPPATAADMPQSISRRNFIELCHRRTADDEKVFEELWRTVGLSVDWTQTYATIDELAQHTSQRAFLDNLARGEAYSQDAPVLWDIDFQSAVAQAELEDRARPGANHRVAFHAPGGAPLHVVTTRPELIPSCVALVASPDDERYQSWFGSTVVSPIFDVLVPVVAHHLADPEKGTGIAMICTWGDLTDVVWWRELDLPTRPLIGQDGRFAESIPDWIETPEGRGAYREIAGLYSNQVRHRIVESLAAAGDLDGSPEPITHPVKFYERGERPLEIVASRQWYIRNGGRDATLRSRMLELGDRLVWVPEFMQVRYQHWVEGLNGDWLISRQRFFGVPVPVWYRLDADGAIRHEDVLLPDLDSLPVDPSSAPPPGFNEGQRGRPGGFVADPDVMDTWATSSLSPQIAGHREDDPDLFSRVFPMDLRPQGPEIIRTWLFATVLRSDYDHGVLPWSHATINGWILDPDRKKMSKSKGNVVTPLPLIEQYGAEAVRYWACNGRPGVDTAVDAGVMKIGRRLATKILNASRFVLGVSGASSAAEVTAPLDRAMLGSLGGVIGRATESFDAFDYARALEVAERSFWSWADDYLELVKARAYGTGGPADSAHVALRRALSIYLRLFAPFLPFVTEEVWSWWREGSVHRAPWPADAEVEEDGADAAVLDAAAQVLSVVRRTKSEARVSMRAPVESIVIRCSATTAEMLHSVEGDLAAAAVATAVSYEDGEFGVEATLTET